MVSEVLWREFGGWFLAPAFHCLIPTGRYLKKPRLLTMQIFFNYVRASVPEWKDTLLDALRRDDLTQVGA